MLNNNIIKCIFDSICLLFYAFHMLYIYLQIIYSFLTLYLLEYRYIGYWKFFGFFLTMLNQQFSLGQERQAVVDCWYTPEN